jgi:DNA-binding transcriptional MerR regulator
MKKMNPVKVKPAADALPEIPSKRYFTIGEVSHLCAVKPHVLRYWEQEFPQLKPGKRRGNRRYYQQEDVVLVRKIRELLYAEGFTIGGARVQLACAKVRKPETPLLRTNLMTNFIDVMRDELESIKTLLS